MRRSYLLRPRWDPFLRKGGEARVANLRLSVDRAAALHRRAAAVADAAQRALDGYAADAVPQQHFAQQHELAEALRAAAAALAPGWLGAPLDATPRDTPLPLGAAGAPKSGGVVPGGTPRPPFDASFPANVAAPGPGPPPLTAPAPEPRER